MWTHSEHPGAVSELPGGQAMYRDNGTLTDGAWELRMRPLLGDMAI